MTIRTQLVTGATGKTGKYVVKTLLDKGQRVRALVHEEDERSDALKALGVDIVAGDLLDHDDVLRATEDVQTAYFCYPIRPGLIQATAYFAHAAKKNGLELVVNMSQISAREDSESHAARDHWIAERVLSDSGAPVLHIRPTLFAEWLTFPWVRDRIVNEGIIALPFGEGTHAPIAAEDQARFIATALTEPARFAGRTIRLFGAEDLSQAQIAEKVGKVLGRPVEYKPETLEQYRESLIGYGVWDILVQHFLAIAVDYQNGIFAGTDDAIRKETGVAPMTVEAFVEANRDAF